MTTTETSPSTPTPDDRAALMPEPGTTANLSGGSNSDADDLIARLAEEQIDGLLDDPAPDDESAAAVEDAIEAASHIHEGAKQVLAAAESELQEELAEIEAAKPPPANSDPVDDTPVASTETISDVEAAAEIEPQAAEHVEPPSFNPPKHAEVPSASLVAHEEIAEPASAAAHAQPESDAEAVARELAADVALLSTPLPAVAEHNAEVAATHVDPWWKRVLDLLLSVPMLVLQAINFPVRPLSDRGREIIGGVGVVTLVNAAGLLIYLAAFAHRH